MTRNEALKELLKENVKEVSSKNLVKKLLIEFRDDEFIILDRDNSIVFKDKLKNYDLDFENQKRFVLNIYKKLFKYVSDKFDCDMLISIICKEKKYDIVGLKGYTYINHYFKFLKSDFKTCKKLKNCLNEMFKNEDLADFNDFKVEVFNYNLFLTIFIEYFKNYKNLYVEPSYIHTIISVDTLNIKYIEGDAKRSSEFKVYLKQSK